MTGDKDALERQRAADDSIDHDDPVEEVFEDQVACADLIILSKSDLLDEAGRRAAEARVTEHLPRAVKVVPAANGNVDPAVLLGLGMATEDDIDARKTHHDDELDHEHDDFDSFVVDLPAVTDIDALVKRIAATAEAENVLRLKGFVHVEGKPMRLLVQAVGPRVSQHYDRAWKTDEQKSTRLVVIGLKGLDRARVERMLAA